MCDDVRTIFCSSLYFVLLISSTFWHHWCCCQDTWNIWASDLTLLLDLLVKCTEAQRWKIEVIRTFHFRTCILSDKTRVLTNISQGSSSTLIARQHLQSNSQLYKLLELLVLILKLNQLSRKLFHPLSRTRSSMMLPILSLAVPPSTKA